MKRISAILMMAMGLAIAGCGLSDPWKTWENEGQLPSDRLLPSELKETLCLSDWWKTSYEGEDFYFQFIDDGTAESNSTIFRDAVSTTFTIDWDEPYALKLTIVGGGHIGYLESGKEDVFIVTSFDDTEIICTGSDNGAEITFVPVTGSDYSSMLAKKAEAYKVIEFAQEISAAGMTSGALWSDGSLVAHWYADFTNDKAYSVRFDILENDVLTHQTVGASLALDGQLTLSSAVTVAGKAVSSISFDVQAKTVSAGNSFTSSVSNAGAWYIGRDYRTYVFKSRNDDSRCRACDAIAKEFDAQAGLYSSIELSDRDNRPFFTIPANWDDGRGYVAIYSNSTPYVDGNEKDRVYFADGTRQEMPFGGDSKWISWTLESYPAIVGTYFNDEGIVIVRDGDNVIWLLSPVDGNWFVAAK